jgi:uncharacterized repeat protein (TIGR04138 family)
MSEQVHPIVRLLQEDTRYKFEAYQFVRDALHFAQEVLRLGLPSTSPEVEPSSTEETDSAEKKVEKHLTGQELCEAIRLFTIEQYGFMAKTVLNSWGLYTTSDFGEVVYNLIRVGFMKKSEADRREDFDNCYDFSEAFVQNFRMTSKLKK